MRKIFVIFGAIFVLTITGCSYTSTNNASGVSIPTHVSHIEFYNGGLMIGSYDNAEVHIYLESRDKIFKISDSDAKTSFITYEIKYNGVEKDYIIDSESLAIKYRK